MKGHLQEGWAKLKSLNGMQEDGGSIPPGSTNLPFEIKGHLFYRPEY
jgi:hypothetical protein